MKTKENITVRQRADQRAGQLSLPARDQ